MAADFKHYREGNLYCYLSIIPPVLSKTDKNDGGNYRARFKRYIGWATSLSEGKRLWVIMRETPESVERFRQFKPERIQWKYDVVTNDAEGMGVDKGFKPMEAPYSPLHSDQGWASLLLPIPELKLLESLSEDALGDVDSHVTILALQSEAQDALDLLKANAIPPITRMLGADDLFFNIIVGKEQGFYDCFLVKAERSISASLLHLSS
ncbi:hypothetical protein ACFSKU_15490 [Pontibacter silvestris]|uniref:Uncharacterized protein n=1 Tax=Pontibacter silvestris TaxID=2305183 RepID=A0ABW4X187_9BACT|nr:hypothetical protein [Pontibacter silvestris]MCC9137529.1 hypothetical protein [Pontibacter silvestris]